MRLRRLTMRLRRELTARYLSQNYLYDYGIDFFKLSFVLHEGIYMFIWDSGMNSWSMIWNFPAHQLAPTLKKGGA